VDALFAELVELPPEERLARLQAYPGDPAVRTEVAELLGALDQGGIDLEPSPGASHLTLGGTSAALAISLAGRRLGPWAVVREIGRGGMGAVYEAFRADDQYQKRVAVKTLTRGADSEIVARRFQQERQILASLEHPGIATLIDGGVTDEGMPYLVMEYVDGMPIDQYVAAHRLPLRARLDLFRQVCAAVQYAHRNLVVHRDVKPSNILVTGDGVVKLVDFGIAKLLAERPADALTLTETGARVFTTGYGSPEQIRGQAISTATDVYSLGATLYRLLAGRLPFEADQLSASEVIRIICEDPPPPPSRVCTDRAATEMGLAGKAALARQLTGELDDIVLAALRKEPERRYATVAALSEDIKRHLQGQQVSARPDTWRYRVGSFTRRNRRLVVAVGLGLSFLVAGTAIASWQAVRAAGERDRARLEAARSARVVSFIEQLLAAPATGALTTATIAALDHAVDRARGELADDPLARAAVFRTAAKAYASHNRGERATPLIDSALVLDRRHAGPRSTEVARDLIVAARIAYGAGILDSAVAHSGEAVTLLRAFPSDRADDLPTALLYHSFALTYAGRPREALPVALEGIALEQPRSPSALLAYLHMAVGEAEIFVGNNARGEVEYARASAIYDSLPGPQPVERGIAELGLASTTIARGAVEDASRHARLALAIFEQHWGPEHAYTGRAHAVLAAIAVRQGDAPLAAREIAATRRALAQSRLGLVDWISIEMSLAYALISADRVGEAVERMQGALDARREELARSPFLLSAGEVLLGSGLLRLGRLREARDAYASAYARQGAAYGPQHQLTLASAANLLFLELLLGNQPAADGHARLFHPDSVAVIRRRAEAWAAAPGGG